MTESPAWKLTKGKVLARNTIYSLIGQGAPLLVAVFTIPQLISGLGTERFGVLTIAWMIISYFSLFDLGLGRALTHLVAEQLGKGEDEKEISKLIWTGSFLMLLLGLLGTLVFAVLSPWLVYSILKLPEALQEETLNTFYLLSSSIPIVTCSAGLVGVLSALQRFDMVNAVRIPLGLFMFIGPLLVLPLSNRLDSIMIVLLSIRLLFGGVYACCCWRAMPVLSQEIRFSRHVLKPLLGFGSWLTISNIIGPIMVSMDRFLIGSIISLSAVAYYTTSFEVVTKLWIIPAAFMSVLFPAFSTSFVNDPYRTQKLFELGFRYIFLALFPIVLILVVFAPDGLNFWLGKEFSDNSSRVLQLFAIGILFNSLAQCPYSLIQGLGRSDITAKLHILELPFYLVILWQLTTYFGIVGAALAWVIRVGIDMLVLMHIAYSKLPKYSPIFHHTCHLFVGLSFILFTMFIGNDLVLKITSATLILSLYVLLSWFRVLNNQERSQISKLLMIF